MMNVYICITALLAILITGLLGYFFVPYLRKLKYGQTILDIGPSWHKAKQGTPTMGGVMFIIGITLASLVGGFLVFKAQGVSFASQEALRLVISLVMMLLFGLVGFIDDYIKVVKKQNEGLTPAQKFIMQLIVAASYLGAMYVVGFRETYFIIPPFGRVDFGLFYYPIAIFIIVGCVNAVNLTDGIDGLASTVTAVSAIALFVFASFFVFDDMKILSIALAGGCIGFLFWNSHPARCFMGDTGSLFLGGAVVAIAFGMDVPFLLLFVGLIYIVETMSVIIQVISFKTTGKRVFKMSPIHHHFEMSGFSEEKIVISFSLVQLISCIIGVLIFSNELYKLIALSLN